MEYFYYKRFFFFHLPINNLFWINFTKSQCRMEIQTHIKSHCQKKKNKRGRVFTVVKGVHRNIKRASEHPIFITTKPILIGRLIRY